MVDVVNLSGLKLGDFIYTLVNRSRIRNFKMELFTDGIYRRDFAVEDATIKLGSGYEYFNNFRDYVVTNYEVLSNRGRMTIRIFLKKFLEKEENLYMPESGFLTSVDPCYSREVLAIRDFDPAPHIDYSSCYAEIAKARKFKVKRVIVNGPATIVLWEDGTKTVAKCLPEDKFDFEKGIAICFMKKATKESCVKIFENARKDNLKKLQDDLAKLNKELEKKKCSENTEGTPT